MQDPRTPGEAMLDQVYGAIADPTRRAILDILAQGEVNVGALAERFPISLNGVSKHVKVLERAGLVERTVQGREHRPEHRKRDASVRALAAGEGGAGHLAARPQLALH